MKKLWQIGLLLVWGLLGSSCDLQNLDEKEKSYHSDIYISQDTVIAGNTVLLKGNVVSSVQVDSFEIEIRHVLNLYNEFGGCAESKPQYIPKLIVPEVSVDNSNNYLYQGFKLIIDEQTYNGTYDIRINGLLNYDTVCYHQNIITVVEGIFCEEEFLHPIDTVTVRMGFNKNEKYGTLLNVDSPTPLHRSTFSTEWWPQIDFLTSSTTKGDVFLYTPFRTWISFEKSYQLTDGDMIFHNKFNQLKNTDDYNSYFYQITPDRILELKTKGDLQSVYDNTSSDKAKTHQYLQVKKGDVFIKFAHRNILHREGHLLIIKDIVYEEDNKGYVEIDILQ